MSSNTIGSLCRNMKRSLSGAKLSFSENTNPSAMIDLDNVNYNNMDNSSSKKTIADVQKENNKANTVDQYGSSEILAGMSEFKSVFKKYKKRRPPPDLSQVIDPRLTAVSLKVADDVVDATEVAALGLRPVSEWRIAQFEGRTGLFILPDMLREDSHETWLKRLFSYSLPPSKTNMTAHGTSPQRDAISEAGDSLRWTVLGVEYDWASKEYPQTGRPIPQELSRLGAIVSSVVGTGVMTPDAAIVNYYPPKTYLSPHVDRSERSNAPLVSVSFGQSAVYLSGGLTLDDPVIPIWLRAGDILVMSGEQRLVYHSVARIERTRNYTFEDKPLEKYANECRINLTIRQVNP